MKILFKSIAFCLAAAPAMVFGNLGDNELKISETYGSPLNEQKLSQSLVERHYRFNGMAISVVFLNGTSQCEEYKQLDGAPLTEEQIQSLLGANANNLSWTSRPSSSGSAREWIIAGPNPSVDASASSRDQAVLAVSPRHVSGDGTKMVAVGVLRPDDNSSSAPSAPPVLRRAVCVQEPDKSALKIFTSAYENVARHERSSRPIADK